MMKPLKKIKTIERYLQYRGLIDKMLDCDFRNELLKNPEVKAGWKKLILNLNVYDFMIDAENRHFNKRYESIWPE